MGQREDGSSSPFGGARLIDRVWLTLLLVVALSAIVVAATGARVVSQGGEWTAVAIIVDLCVFVFALAAILVGAMLRREYSRRSSLMSWTVLGIWSMVGLLPIVLFAANHAWKVFVK